MPSTTHIWCGHHGSGVVLRVGSVRAEWCDACAQTAAGDLARQLDLKPAAAIPGDGAVQFVEEPT